MLAKHLDLARLRIREYLEEVRLVVVVQPAYRIREEFHAVIVQVGEQALFAFEVMEQKRLGDARLARDLVGGCLLVPMLREYVKPRVDDRVAPLFRQSEKPFVHGCARFPDASTCAAAKRMLFRASAKHG